MVNKAKLEPETTSKTKTEKNVATEEHIKFGAEVGKILHLMIHSLYANRPSVKVEAFSGHVINALTILEIFQLSDYILSEHH